MNLKNRIEKIEQALHAGGGVKIEWIEPDENGNFPPPTPGAKIIDLSALWAEPPDAEPVPRA